MHLVLEILLGLQFWILYCCCMVIALNEHQVLVFCFPAVVSLLSVTWLSSKW